MVNLVDSSYDHNNYGFSEYHQTPYHDSYVQYPIHSTFAYSASIQSTITDICYPRSTFNSNSVKLDDYGKKRIGEDELLAAWVNSKKFDKIDAFFKELPAALSIEPDLVSYNTVIKALCESNSFDSAVSMLDEMEKKGIAPDLVTFNTILYALYVNDRFSDAEKIWNQMVKNNISPDIRTYNAKLHGLVFEKRMGEAVELVEEMRSTGIKPDVFSFNALIRGFVNEKKVKEAKRWYSEMGDNGFGGDKMTFTTLVPFLFENGDDELAFELCKEIFKRRSLVDESILQLMVDELVKKLKIDEAKELVVLGKTNGYWRYRLKLPQDK